VYVVVIDAHLHLWDTGRLRYEWLQRPENAAINRTFGFEDFRSRAAAAGVDRAVLVQADDSAADTEAMFEVAAAHPEIAGVVGWVPLDRPDEAAAELARLQFTQGVYEARELALARMQAEAAQARASGIVGVTVEVKNHVWGEHATEFLATGTAIRRLADEHKLPETTPKPTFTLGLDH
jgi:predicted TIM-barrel fold metal-dependent hydrolase